MRFRIHHDFVLSYPAPAKSIIMVLRLTPRSHEGQHIVAWRIDLHVDCLMNASEDAFGNIVHMFNVEGPLQRVGILVGGEVETFDAAGIVRGAPERMPVPLFLRETMPTSADASLRAFAAEVAATRNGTLDILHGLMNAIHATIAFDAEADATVAAAEAFTTKRGGAPDFAQIFIACARHLNIPARYVSGFFSPAGDDDGSARMHGWAEAFVPEIGWIGFDAQNNLCPQENHVRIACGLDRLGASPLRAARADAPCEAPTITIRKGPRNGKPQSQSQQQS
ncbi:MAG TPA: transglutaminase family protein [Beijerinckiaceae bacterium]|nr:transglutaminase family protein [Beijerinckiaceae bacterium]